MTKRSWTTRSCPYQRARHRREIGSRPVAGQGDKHMGAWCGGIAYRASHLVLIFSVSTGQSYSQHCSGILFRRSRPRPTTRQHEWQALQMNLALLLQATTALMDACIDTYLSSLCTLRFHTVHTGYICEACPCRGLFSYL